MNILVADDDEVFLLIMEKILHPLGECTCVMNGEAALEAFKAAWRNGLPYNVIFLDIYMPDISGMEVLSCIRQMERDKDLRRDMLSTIFMMTAQADKKIVLECFEKGCDNFVVKPLNEEKIFEMLYSIRS